MMRNVGTPDRVVRLLAAAVLVVAGVMLGPLGVLPVVLYVLAGVMLLTGLVGMCPIYSLLGVSTCPVKRSSGAPTREASGV